MIHFIMAANEIEHRMMLARCGMTQSVLGGQLDVVERDNRERWRLWQTGEHLLCPQVAAMTAPVSVAGWGWESGIARASNFW